MAKIVNGKRYEKAEVTFNTNDDLDMEIYKHLLEQSVVIGKSNYLKQLAYRDMKKGRK